MRFVACRASLPSRRHGPARTRGPDGPTIGTPRLKLSVPLEPRVRCCPLTIDLFNKVVSSRRNNKL
eukprot:4327483-Pleurochrysis_carterae.AAC.1